MNAEKLKHAHRSRTNWFALVVVILGAVQANLPGVQGLAGKWYGLITMLIGVLIVAFRFVTDKPLDQR